jgi:hypothetical protein
MNGKKMSRAKLLFNKLPAIQRELPQQMEVAVAESGDELLDVLQRALDDGYKGVESDTRALALSLYVKATGRDDYDAALAAARDAYANNPSRYHATPASEATMRGFDKIVADFEALRTTEAHVQTAAVATMLSYGNVREFESEWMSPPAFEWAKARFGAVAAAGLLKAYR